MSNKTSKKKKAPKKIKRIDEDNPEHFEEKISEQIKQQDKVQTEIIINNGVVIVNPVYNPLDENK